MFGIVSSQMVSAANFAEKEASVMGISSTNMPAVPAAPGLAQSPVVVFVFAAEMQLGQVQSMR